jgi:bifunctional isochorismate lyase/aryl carrier protein
MQKYFVGAYQPDSEPIRSVLANITVLRDACDAAGIPVFYTAQNVQQDQVERGLQREFWGPGMQSETEHRPIVPELRPRAHDRVLDKRRYSAFQQSTFGDQLADLGRDQLIITGVFAHIGCLVTAADAFMREIQPFFVGDAVADFSRHHHDIALAQVAGCTGRVLMTAAAVAELGAFASSRD